MRLRPLVVTLSLSALALPALAGCGGEEALTVYSGRTENLVGPIIDDFTATTGLDVKVRYLDSAEMALLVQEEGEGTPADVVISQSPGALGYLTDLGLLATLPDTTLERVAPGFRNADGQWVGMSGRVRTLVYNTDLVLTEELPDSVFDLTDRAYAGRVALAPTNGSFQDFVTAMREQYGDDVAGDWLDGMAANNARPYADNTSIVQAVARGEVPMGLVNHYYNERALAEDPSLSSQNFFFPDGDIGSLLIATGAAIPVASDRSDDAQTLVDFLLSEQAQTFFSEETFEYPLASDASAADVLPPLDSLEYATYDLDALGGGLGRTLELIEASGLAG